MAKYETPTIMLTYMVENVICVSGVDPVGDDKQWVAGGND